MQVRKRGLPSALTADLGQAGIGFDFINIFLRGEAAPFECQQQAKDEHGDGSSQSGKLNGIEFHIQEPNGVIAGDRADLSAGKEAKEGEEVTAYTVERDVGCGIFAGKIHIQNVGIGEVQTYR